MSRLTDTHSHLYSEVFHADLDAVIARAQETLDAVYLPNVSLSSVVPMLELSRKVPGFFLPMIGLHPCEVKEGFEHELDTLRQWLHDPACTWYGIGETGLDLYWDKSTLPLQIEALQVQIQWAKETQLPIILHARNAIDETTEQIEQSADSNLRGIFHCFDGTIAQAERILALGSFKLGIGGIVTYRKDVQEVVRQLPKNAVVLETDSPYLPPEPFRKSKNRRNESSYTRYVGESVAQLWGISYEEVAELTNLNAKEVFASKKN